MDRKADSGILRQPPTSSRHEFDSNGFVSRRSPVQSRVPAQDPEQVDIAGEIADLGAENWRQVGVTPYEVSDKGRVRRGSRILALRGHTRGYLIVDISIDGKPTSKTVHRLVADAFLGPSEGRQVNHRNGVKSENAVENLEWTSAKQNTRHAIDAGLRDKMGGLPRVAAGGSR